MTPDEIAVAIKANVGKKVKCTPRPHEHSGTTPSILLAVGVDDEGFTCYDFSDPDLIDTPVMNWASFDEIDGVYPVENSK